MKIDEKKYEIIKYLLMGGPNAQTEIKKFLLDISLHFSKVKKSVSFTHNFLFIYAGP